MFTIDTEAGEETRVPHLHILWPTIMSSWVVGAVQIRRLGNAPLLDEHEPSADVSQSGRSYVDHLGS